MTIWDEELTEEEKAELSKYLAFRIVRNRLEDNELTAEGRDLLERILRRFSTKQND